MVVDVVGIDGELPLPWLAAPLADVLASQRGHALLLHATPGAGALHFALALAQAWLCEAVPGIRQPCGRCGSCRLVQSHVHPDLQVLLPEFLRREHDWPLAGDKPAGEDDRRKPSRQIKVDDVRDLIDRVHCTTARGRGKVVLLHPAEALNAQSANALLKTLEEPPEGTRLLMTTADPALLLPTVLSRCQRIALPDMPVIDAEGWLAAQGIGEPGVLLAACSGRPLEALALARGGVDARVWSALPAAMARGQGGAFAGWPIPRVLDALHKLCHDAMAVACGARPRFFAADRMPAAAPLPALAAWSRELDRVARHDDHPWNEPLLVDMLVQAASRALAPDARQAHASRHRLDTLAG